MVDADVSGCVSTCLASGGSRLTGNVKHLPTSVDTALNWGFTAVLYG